MQEKGRDGGNAAGSDLIRDLRDVGTGKIPHVFLGCCPDVQAEGIEAENDRADPLDECKACDVLRRADDVLGKVSDRSDTLLKGLAAFREKMLASVPDEGARIELDSMLLKFIERAEAIIPYVLATLPCPDPNLAKSSVTTSHPDWVAIHKGRGISSARQLEVLLKEVSGAGR